VSNWLYDQTTHVDVAFDTLHIGGYCPGGSFVKIGSWVSELWWEGRKSPPPINLAYGLLQDLQQRVLSYKPRGTMNAVLLSTNFREKTERNPCLAADTSAPEDFLLRAIQMYSLLLLLLLLL